MRKTAPILPLLLLAAACATTQVDMDEPRRLLGREDNIRLDAQIIGDRIAPGQTIGITYEVQNLRDTPIAIAEVVASSDFDPATRTITISLGSEVPGNEMVPRLIVVAPGEKRSFTAGARTNVVVAPQPGQASAYPQSLSIKLNYLAGVEPFRQLVGIPEKAIADPALANSLFTAWVENNRSVITNTIPIRWQVRSAEAPAARRRAY